MKAFDIFYYSWMGFCIILLVYYLWFAPDKKKPPEPPKYDPFDLRDMD